MTKQNKKINLGTYALIAGLSLLIMVLTAPFAEMYVLPKLIVSNNATQTILNIKSNETLFGGAILAYLTTFIADIILAWALYLFLKPVNESISLLAAIFRLAYSILAIVALFNLVSVYHATLDTSVQFQDQIMFSLFSFRKYFYFSISLFSINLFLLGFLTYKATYIPKFISICLFISGIGYFLNSIKPFLLRGLNLDFAMFTFFGELVFMFWLLIKGSKIKDIE